jgi:hypothetical protein
MTITDRRQPDRVLLLDDYCPRCNPLGHYTDSRVRVTSLTGPTSAARRGGKYVICRYQCDGCGHQWRRGDLWDAQSAGFDRRGCMPSPPVGRRKRRRAEFVNLNEAPLRGIY